MVDRQLLPATWPLRLHRADKTALCSRSGRSGRIGPPRLTFPTSLLLHLTQTGVDDSIRAANGVSAPGGDWLRADAGAGRVASRHDKF
jgi:hypothetical protein